MKNVLFFILAFFSLLLNSCALFEIPTRPQSEPGPRITRMGFEDDSAKDARAYEIVQSDFLQNWKTHPNAETLFAVAENEHRMNLDSVALARLKNPQVQSLVQSSSQLQLLLAEIYFSLELFEIAEQHYFHILQTENKSLLLRWRLFSCYEKTKSYDKALIQLQELQSFEPDQSFLAYKRGKILSAMSPEKSNQAIAEFEKAVALKPDFKAANLELAELLMKNSRYEESAKLLGLLERKFGPDFDVHKAAGEASLRSGDFEDAERRFLVLSKSASFGLEAYKKLAEVYRGQQNLGKQIWALNEALQIDIADDQLRLQLTEAYLQGNQILEAQKYALEISPQSDLYIDGQEQLIRYFEKNQDNMSAQTKRQQLALKYPDNPRVKEIVSAGKSDFNRSPATKSD